MKLQLSLKLQSIPWWRVPGSNRWPPACKAGALPAELTPHMGSSFVQKWWAKMDSLSCGKATAVTTCHRHVVKSRLSSYFVSNTLLTLEVVGQNGLEPSTSRLSVVCSSQLSYWPISSKSNPQFTHLMQSIKRSLCLCFSSSHKTRFAGLLWEPFSASLLGTFFSVPSKLNNTFLPNTILYWP